MSDMLIPSSHTGAIKNKIGTIKFAYDETDKILIVNQGPNNTSNIKIQSTSPTIDIYSTQLDVIDIDWTNIDIMEYGVKNQSNNLKEFIVTAESHDDLDSLYHDLESHGCGSSSCCPHRQVECVSRRPNSRNTHYLMTQEEANALLKDKRVKAIELTTRELGYKPTPVWTQTSSQWNKDKYRINNQMINWGLLSSTNKNITPYGQDTQIPDLGTININPSTGVISGIPASRWYNNNEGTTLQEIKVAVTDSSNPTQTAQNIASFYLSSYSPGHITATPNPANSTGLEINRNDTLSYSFFTSISDGWPPYSPDVRSYWHRPEPTFGYAPTPYSVTAQSISGQFTYEGDEELWFGAQDYGPPPVLSPETAVLRLKVNPLPSDKTFTISPSYSFWRQPYDFGSIPKNSSAPVESIEFTLSAVNTSFTDVYVDCYMYFPTNPMIDLNENFWTYSLSKVNDQYKLKIIANPAGFEPGTYMGVIMVSGPGVSWLNPNKVYKKIYCKITISGTPGAFTATSSRFQYAGGAYSWMNSYDTQLDIIATAGTPIAPLTTFTNVTGGTPPYTYSFYNGYGWGLNNKALSTTGTASTIASGKNVDTVLIDEGPLVNHIEFFRPDSGETRLNKIFLDEWIDQPRGHSTHVASTMSGNSQGWARNSRIYPATFIHPGGDFNAEVFDNVRAWHNSKGINPNTGVKNPTVVNNSWSFLDTAVIMRPSDEFRNRISSVTYRGTTYSTNIDYRPYGIIDPKTGANDTWPPWQRSSIQFQGGLYVDTQTTAGAAIVWRAALAGSMTVNGSKIVPGAEGLTEVQTPTVGNNTDGYWEIDLPWPVKMWDPGLLYSYVRPPIVTSKLWISTKGYISFEGLPSSPNAGKTVGELPGVCIAMHIGDNSCQRIFHGEVDTGYDWHPTAYKIRWEGHHEPTGGVLGSPTLAWEVSFFKPKIFPDPPYSDPNFETLWIEIYTQENKLYDKAFKIQQLKNWGVPLTYNYAMAQVPSVDADVEDCVAAGMIMVAAAGNDSFYICSENDPDYNNSMSVLDYGNGIAYDYYYNRASSPATNCIVVGAIGNNSDLRRASFSNYGSRVDIWAPGEAIMGAFTAEYYYTAPVPDSRYQAQYLNKLAGTSMASPQVSGIIALALENNPRMNQDAVLKYIQSHGVENVYNKPTNQVDTNGYYTDAGSLNGSSTKSIFYNQERPNTGIAVPKNNVNARPGTGQVYPRSKIYRYHKSS